MRVCAERGVRCVTCRIYTSQWLVPLNTQATPGLRLDLHSYPRARLPTLPYRTDRTTSPALSLAEGSRRKFEGIHNSTEDLRPPFQPFNPKVVSPLGVRWPPLKGPGITNLNQRASSQHVQNKRASAQSKVVNARSPPLRLPRGTAARLVPRGARAVVAAARIQVDAPHCSRRSRHA